MPKGSNKHILRFDGDSDDRHHSDDSVALQRHDDTTDLIHSTQQSGFPRRDASPPEGYNNCESASECEFWLKLQQWKMMRYFTSQYDLLYSFPPGVEHVVSNLLLAARGQARTYHPQDLQCLFCSLAENCIPRVD